ncbi:DUF3656 domain-containing protein [uncultured Megasphaera sp.]|uniref:DUF3656 domain-containing U32 family peptidase n=1 Tax=uncultured Megasphaera sp. TaxID=165188 RepID=UPI0025CC17C1|nr:U32 family peptidase [uncultured Megasphaera sp.]
MAELLAPAGSLDNVLTAIDAGADAVYFGGKSFNARRFAHNLDDDEIVRAVRTAHLFGVKVYVTVNILMADTELDDLTAYLQSLDRAGVDGIIVQDLAVALLARRVVPNLPLHGSTQMTVADSDGVRFLEEKGFTQAVLSRELSLSEIKSVCSQSPLAIEVFIHGASCMAYSGQCLMSSFLGGRSGNRGACAQPCRQPYTLVRDGKEVMKQEAYVLSLKDLKALDYIDDLLDAGVTSFKIEGRMKGDTYVRTVVTAYRKVIDAHNSSPKTRKSAHDEAAALLTAAFNRSYQDDFLAGAVNRRTLTEKNPSGRQTAEDVPVGLTRKIPIYAHVETDSDDRLSLTLWDEKGHTASATADFQPQPASKRPATVSYMAGQLGRLGETPFTLEEVTAWDETKMIPASVLNDLRRQAAEALTAVILDDYQRPAAGLVADRKLPAKSAQKEKMELVVRCDTVDAVTAAAENGADIIVFGGESYHHRPFLKEDWKAAHKAAHDHGAALWAGTPRIVSESQRTAVQGELERAVASGIDGIYAGAMAVFTMAKRVGKGLPVRADWSLNIFNSQAASAYAALGCSGITASLEATLRQIRDMARKSPCPIEAVVEGRVEMMVTESCVISSFAGNGKKKGCPNICQGGAYALRDRRAEDFPVATDQYCRNHILNSRDLDMAPYYKDLRRAGLAAVRIEGRGRSPKWLAEQVSRYRRLVDGTETLVLGKEDQTVTRGHFFHGIL